MRYSNSAAHGCIDSARGLGPEGHACWGFERPEEFVDAALEFFTDGLRSNRRLVYLSGEPVAEQRERLDPLGDVGGMVDTGALHLLELKDLYRLGEPVDPVAQVALFTAAAEAARADGFSGLSLATQSTDMVAEPRTWEAHLRMESRADRWRRRRGCRRSAATSARPCPKASSATWPRSTPPPTRWRKRLPSTSSAKREARPQRRNRPLLDPGAIRALTHAHTPGEPTCPRPRVAPVHRPPRLRNPGRPYPRLAADGGCSVHNRPRIVNRLGELLEMEL